MVMASSFRKVLQTYSEIYIFCIVIQYIESKKQLVGSVHEVLVESFAEARFVVNSHSFFQP